MKRVMVSGCYDLLHTGHIEFFEKCAEIGELYVCLGSDANIAKLKGRSTLFTELERRKIVGSLRCVKEARISRGEGMLDFVTGISRASALQ